MGDLEEYRHRKLYGELKPGDTGYKKDDVATWKIVLAEFLLIGISIVFLSYTARQSGERERQTYYLWVEYTGRGDVPYKDWQTLRTYNALPGTVLPVESN